MVPRRRRGRLAGRALTPEPPLCLARSKHTARGGMGRRHAATTPNEARVLFFGWLLFQIIFVFHALGRPCLKAEAALFAVFKLQSLKKPSLRRSYRKPCQQSPPTGLYVRATYNEEKREGVVFSSTYNLCWAINILLSGKFKGSRGTIAPLNQARIVPCRPPPCSASASWLFLDSQLSHMPRLT